MAGTEDSMTTQSARSGVPLTRTTPVRQYVRAAASLAWGARVRRSKVTKGDANSREPWDVYPPCYENMCIRCRLLSRRGSVSARSLQIAIPPSGRAYRIRSATQPNSSQQPTVRHASLPARHCTSKILWTMRFIAVQVKRRAAQRSRSITANPPSWCSFP